MKDKKKTGLVLAIVLTMAAHAQTVQNNTLNAAGNSTINSNVFLEWSVGESFTGQGTSSNYLLLTHGFLQPFGGATATPPGIPSLPVNSFSNGIDNAGNSVLAGNILLENTVGEWMTTTRTGGSYMLTQGILQPSQQTVNIPLPVTGLTFTAKRLHAGTVQLNWKTLTETDNKGFYIERKLDKAPDFTQLKFVSSKAANGNSTVALDYTETDANSFSGKSWYRLRQEDLTGKNTYSTVELVNGVKGKPVKLTAWPVPAPSEFSVLVEGLEKDKLQVFDVSGRLRHETTITQGQAVKISHLMPGTYILRLVGNPDLVHKIIVMGNKAAGN
ncbi:T9SS type A sorting domain-containing protein [Flavisolibacter sp. BT320]|nr:T9SS type A sorting domain-containing protein [Flavisolibacter longurius]